MNLGCFQVLALRWAMVALAMIATILMTIGAPLEMYHQRVGDSCITLWGTKARCATEMTAALQDASTCNEFKDRIQAASVIAIFTIAGHFVSMALYIYQGLGFESSALLVGAVGIQLIAAVLNTVTVALVANAYHAAVCNQPPLSVSYQYGAGFGLFASALSVSLLGVALLIYFKFRSEKLAAAVESAKHKKSEPDASEPTGNVL